MITKRALCNLYCELSDELAGMAFKIENLENKIKKIEKKTSTEKKTTKKTQVRKSKKNQ